MGRYNYKLETHLKILCEDNREFENLCSSWTLNKKTYTEVLGTIKLNFPHYSLHDASHSESIISNIEMILGEERIKKLSPSDTWMLLNCAYLHDFGMAVLYSDVKNEWTGEEFQKYLKRLKNSYDKNLKEAADYIDNFSKNLYQNNTKIELDSIWPLRIKKYVTEIVSDYYRRKHSNMSIKYLQNLKEWELDFTQNGLIKERLIELIGQISVVHTGDFDEVMKLDYQTNGYNCDYIHPRFVAVMLRLGDLLDLDNGRFSEAIEKVNGEMPDTSKIHKAKHKATKHILVNTSEIQFRADCENDDVYRATRDWISWLEEELRNSSLNVDDIFPKDLGGYIPKLTKREILLNGKPDLEGKADLKFRISQERAFDIIEGSNIYDDKFVFIREFIQNAMDASKIQLWKDLNKGMYDFILKDKLEKYDNRYSKLTPFDLLEKNIFDNYEIKISVENEEVSKTIVTIQDKGTGINIDKLKAMCDVGESYNHRIYEKEYNIDSMPAWLKPTGSFGIGMHSAFLVTNKFKALTKHDKYKNIEINFEKSTNGYISIREVDEDKILGRGTKFIIEIEDPYLKSIDYGLVKLYNAYFDNLKTYIHTNIKHSFFKIILFNKNNDYEKIIDFGEKWDFDKSNSKYLYKIEGIEGNNILWDKENNLYIRILNKSNEKEEISFKGFRLNTKSNEDLLENGIRVISKVFSTEIDIYGLETRESINLSRDKLTKIVEKKIQNYKNDAIKFFLEESRDYILKSLEQDKKDDIYDEEYINNEKKYIHKMILLSIKYLNNFDAYQDIANKLDYDVDIIRKEGNKFKSIKVKYKEFYNIIRNKIQFITYKKDIFLNEEQTLNILSENIDRIEDDTVIIKSDILSEICYIYLITDINCINMEKEIYMYSMQPNERKGIKVDIIVRQQIINSLVYYNNTERNYIPAIEDYFMLAVNKIPPGINATYFAHWQIEANYIISPITNTNININIRKDENSFIKCITEEDSYKKLIDYTVKYGIEQDHTPEEIDQKYRDLISEYYKLNYVD